MIVTDAITKVSRCKKEFGLLTVPNSKKALFLNEQLGKFVGWIVLISPLRQVTGVIAAGAMRKASMEVREYRRTLLNPRVHQSLNVGESYNRCIGTL